MAIEEYYDKRSPCYDSTFGMLCFKVFDAIAWKYIEPYVPVDPDVLVLDAGGGTGRWTIRMARKGCRVILMDI
jgi:ubiquinone/menaquinone biosynthesis C-methylase UbiE